jgi:hypothetical protein
MNPIKTPQEMLAEMAGIPRMAGGSAVAGQFDKAIAGAVAKFKKLYGKSPTPQEMQALQAHVQGLSRPTSGLRSGKDAEARAQFELGTDLNLINPNTARDPFLTKMQLDRTPKGTQLKPKTFDITDPNVTKNIEERQMAGLMDEDIPDVSQRISSTPSADYFGEVSSNIENAALQGGAFDMLKAEFVKKFGRYPDADETNQIIADYNIMRQQYGPKGISVVGERPRTAKGMEEFRAQARNEGIEESALTNPPADYPKYLKNELAIQRGELPAVAIPKAKKKSAVEPTDFYTDENGNLVKVFPTMKADGGHITPEEMRHMMLVQGQTPQKFKNGGSPSDEYIADMTSAKLGQITPRTLKHSDPYLQADMENYIPEPTAVGLPNTPSSYVNEKAAKLIGQKNADRIFGGPRAQPVDRLMIQTLNPVNYATGVLDAGQQFYKSASEGDKLGAAGAYGMGILNALPFLGRKLTAAQRVGNVVNPNKNLVNVGLTGASEIPELLTKRK